METNITSFIASRCGVVRIDHLESGLNFKKIERTALHAFWLLYDTDCTIHFPRSNSVDKIAIPDCERLARVYTLDGIDSEDKSLSLCEESGPLRVKLRSLSDSDGRVRTEYVDSTLFMSEVYIDKELHERVFEPIVDMMHLVELDLADTRDLDEHLPSPWNVVVAERDAEVLFELDENDVATLSSAVATVGDIVDLSKATFSSSKPTEVYNDTDDIIVEPRVRKAL
ncbi:hypothetical protein CYMTET_2554 [Cymbomonas tetramitiformis]|uniref:Uncharacterized protein n=1 Tax=Cymbomonas tetramitiformis TaxID=36881 RepID=A0AAE0LLQ7_9CHLO|nr:hypothetical protein CYMTET_2554 [Cymbomonas tetramitiformis]|eukprot:gene3759-4702_t